MAEQFVLTTPRLSITPLATEDAGFILELVNTEGWIKFIGDRNIHSEVDADTYIQKILANENITYWKVRLKDSEVKIGLVTLIKRDYLEHKDIGFAFLPHFSKSGYAFEATQAVLNKLIADQDLKYIAAVTVPQNITSVNLLKKLGLNFEREITPDKDLLHLYGASSDTLNT